MENWENEIIFRNLLRNDQYIRKIAFFFFCHPFF